MKPNKEGFYSGGLCAEERTKSQLTEFRDPSGELPVFSFHGRGAACTSKEGRANS